jgi:hypothetical protein
MAWSAIKDSTKTSRSRRLEGTAGRQYWIFKFSMGLRLCLSLLSTTTFFLLLLGYLLFSCLWWVYLGTSGVAKSMELRGLKTDLTVGWSDWHQQYPVVSNPVVPSHWRVPVDLVKYSMDRWLEVSSCTHQYPTVQEPLLKYKVRSCFFSPWCETRI